MAHNDSMHFKQFSLEQVNCGMRIGTDGVLLGGWATLEEGEETKQPLILDVGTGTGLIALMMGQRYPSAQINGIEIEPLAAQTAQRNVDNSPFASRIAITCADFVHYATQIKEHSIALIVSNPPFFTPGPATRNAARATARFTDTLSPSALFAPAKRLLQPNGRLAMITPFDQLNELRTEALAVGLHPVRLVSVITIKGKEPKRLLSEWTPSREHLSFCPVEQLIIREKEQQYSEEYRFLLKDFYLFL